MYLNIHKEQYKVQNLCNDTNFILNANARLNAFRTVLENDSVSQINVKYSIFFNFKTLLLFAVNQHINFECFHQSQPNILELM